MAKGGTGTNTSTIIDIRKKRKAYLKKTGTVKCQDCSYFQFGYYCSKEKKTSEYYNKPKVCRWFKRK